VRWILSGGRPISSGYCTILQVAWAIAALPISEKVRRRPGDGARSFGVDCTFEDLQATCALPYIPRIRIRIEENVYAQDEGNVFRVIRWSRSTSHEGSARRHVNPVDYKTRAGEYPGVNAAQLPTILGRDVSGTIVDQGAAVTRFEKGDEVYAMLDAGHGGYAEYVTLRAHLCAPKPARLTHIEAAAVPLAALTAWQGLFDHGQLRPGQRVLIHGGAGGVGHLAIQFAKARGAYVASTVSKSDKNFVRSLGADQAIGHEAERFEELVAKVDLVFDLVAGEVQERSWAILKKGGTFVSTLNKPSQQQRTSMGHAR